MYVLLVYYRTCTDRLDLSFFVSAARDAGGEGWVFSRLQLCTRTRNTHTCNAYNTWTFCVGLKIQLVYTRRRCSTDDDDGGGCKTTSDPLPAVVAEYEVFVRSTFDGPANVTPRASRAAKLRNYAESVRAVIELLCFMWLEPRQIF